MQNNILRILGLDNSEPFHYELDIDADAIQNLLKFASDAEGTVFFLKRFRFRALSRDKFQLSYHGRRNSLGRILRASLKDKGSSTTLTAHFEVPFLASAFTILWQLAATLIATAFLISSGTEMLPVLMLPLFGFALPHIGRFMSLKDERILKLLDQALAGHVRQRMI